QAGRVAFTKALRILGDFFLQCVGGKRGQDRTTTGQDTQARTHGSTTDHGRPGLFELLLVGVQATYLARDLNALVAQFQVVHDFGETEYTHGYHGKVDTVLQLWNTKVVAGHAGVHVCTDHTQQQTQQDHADSFGQGARSQHHSTDQAQDH